MNRPDWLPVEPPRSYGPPCQFRQEPWLPSKWAIGVIFTCSLLSLGMNLYVFSVVYKVVTALQQLSAAFGH